MDIWNRREVGICYYYVLFGSVGAAIWDVAQIAKFAWRRFVHMICNLELNSSMTLGVYQSGSWTRIQCYALEVIVFNIRSRYSLSLKFELVCSWSFPSIVGISRLFILLENRPGDLILRSIDNSRSCSKSRNEDSLEDSDEIKTTLTETEGMRMVALLLKMKVRKN